jgi:hypothetical protein
VEVLSWAIEEKEVNSAIDRKRKALLKLIVVAEAFSMIVSILFVIDYNDIWKQVVE